MPLKRCTSNGVSGWRWGTKGKCYTGPDAKKKAIKQGYAEDPKHFNKIMNKESKGSITIQDIYNILVDDESTVEECEALLPLLQKLPIDFIMAQEHIKVKKLATQSN